MLREFVEKKHVKFADSAPDWREAIRMSCEVLEADGTIEENYKEDIIACVEKYGPYIVIAPKGEISLSKTSVKAVRDGNVQKTPDITLSGDHRNYISVNVFLKRNISKLFSEDTKLRIKKKLGKSVGAR